ncbi:MAG TPA: PQQ-dependent sugar dehydrogenase [Flavitalea sp.]|nr:PQQ-dependent sugar dehydrogenase [Flavitalea sp.]
MKLPILGILIISVTIFSGCSSDKREPVADSAYEIQSISAPDWLTYETGGIDFLPDGRLAACFQRGEVMLYDPKTKEWTLFAHGLHDPLGIMAVSKSEFLVIQRPELTRVKDTDGDGKADVFETVTDDFGQAGNYHEFNFGPVKDKSGNLYIAISLPSEGGKIMPETRGRIDTNGVSPVQFSVVPYQGWILKITPDGKQIPYAMGFRTQNGIGFDLDEHLLVTDNQGDWVGTSKLYHVQEGNFYGHPASLVWKKDWNRGSPYKIPISELDSMRTRAAVLFPHGIMSKSPTQPVPDNTQGKFGPFSGQIFVGEMNSERIIRVMLETVDGELQGACIPFIDGRGLRKGNNRLAFAPDGSLWVGQTSHGWPGDDGIQRIVFTGKQPMDVYSMNLTSDGFDLVFTQPVDSVAALNPDNYKFQRYYYEYRQKYGSPRIDVQSIDVENIAISPDRKKISLVLSSLKPGYIYQLNMENLRSGSGDSLANSLICYTLNKLRR